MPAHRTLVRNSRPPCAVLLGSVAIGVNDLAGVQWMECEAALIRLWEYLDQELGPEEALSVGEHLRTCLSCHPRYCRDRSFLALLARQRDRCSAPSSLVLWAHRCFLP
jgi:hypothetical protein